MEHFRGATNYVAELKPTAWFSGGAGPIF